MTKSAVSTLVKQVDQGHGLYTDESDLGEYSTAQQAVAEKMTVLVKGAGYAVTEKTHALGAMPGANQPLSDPDTIFKKSMRASSAWNKAMRRGIETPDEVFKALSPDFASRFGAFMSASPQNQMWSSWTAQLQQQLGEALGKSITLTSPLSTGFVPFNLVAPSRLIYPVYSPYRNKISRTQGQGTSYRAKVVTGVSGSQTGSSGGAFVDIAIPELVQGGGNMSNWPLNLPASGNQDSVDLNVPYRFSGLSENVSWLAQFAGQGFEDISALANLILLQEYMLSEEAAMIAATSTALSTPSAPTLTVRNANTGETGLTKSGNITNSTVNVEVTAANYFGETAASSATVATSVTSGTSVIDVVITPVAGAQWYNIYVSVGSSPSTYYRMKTQAGGINFTLQGVIPSAGTVAPTGDTGTYSPYRMEGIVPVLAGHSQGSNQVYPAGWQGGYVNLGVGDTLKTSVINAALQGLWDGSGAFRADPAELVGEGGDIMRLSNDIVQQGSATNYRLFVQQTDTPGVRAGAAVSEFVNPVTRSIVRIVVHPWYPQGAVDLMSYTLPFAWSNVSNVWEMNMVQDYLSIGWPVIDATFRYSMFTYGSMVANAPQYCGRIGGLQVSDRSGSVGTWS